MENICKERNITTKGKLPKWYKIIEKNVRYTVYGKERKF